jgi:hypothetical protein
MPADYIKSLRGQYVENLVNAMIVAVLRRGQPEFTRPYALLSLLKLFNDNRDGFSVDDIFEIAQNEHYGGTKPGILAGLKALYASGVVVRKAGLYRLHPRFKIEVEKRATDIRRAMGGTP